MARLLYDNAAEATRPYPRQDDEPVLGLDRDRYRVLAVVDLPQPDHDPATETVTPTETIVWDSPSDGCDGTLTRGWRIDPIEPPPPPQPAADWARFRDEVLNSKELLQVLGEATQHPDGEVRARASMLVPLYLLAEGNGVAPFRDTWRHLVTALPVPAEIVEGAITAATNCNLPEEFIQALQPED